MSSTVSGYDAWPVKLAGYSQLIWGATVAEMTGGVRSTKTPGPVHVDVRPGAFRVATRAA